MRNVMLFLWLLLMVFISCKRTSNFCGVGNPINDINWLKLQTQDTIVNKIYEATYKSMDGFLIEDCYNNCNTSFSAFYTCNDSEFCNFGGLTGTNCPDFASQETYQELIYSK